MKVIRYEDEFCYYVRKPWGIPTTFGKEKSFLEYLFQWSEKGWSCPFISLLSKTFTKDEERGLLNRLDNATSWLLYFAKTPEIKANYKTLQQAGMVHKYYLLEVYGDIKYRVEKNGLVIDFPIAHHKFAPEKMVVIDNEDKKNKADIRYHRVQTEIVEFQWNELSKTTTLIVKIEKWIRHQIRSHLSVIGYPIVGDELYGKKKDPKRWNLQLFSVGLSVKG